MLEKYLQYAKEYFIQYGGYNHPDSRYNFRSKYEHTLRVLKWCNVLKNDGTSVNTDIFILQQFFMI